MRNSESANPDNTFTRVAISFLLLGGLLVAVIGALLGDLGIASAGLGAIGGGVYWAAKGKPPKTD